MSWVCGDGREGAVVTPRGQEQTDGVDRDRRKGKSPAIDTGGDLQPQMHSNWEITHPTLWIAYI
jgi:hypothetical protein